MQELGLFLAGDALIIEPWSHVQDPAFDRLVAEMRAADATHRQSRDGDPRIQRPRPGRQRRHLHGLAAGHRRRAEMGGCRHGRPRQQPRVRLWLDRGSRDARARRRRRGWCSPEPGRDLQDARAPRYLACAGGTVALVAMASSFIRYGKASRSRPDLHGRPGLNPLELDPGRRGRGHAADSRGVLRRIARLRGKPRDRWKGPSFRLFGRRFEVAATTRRVSGRRAVDRRCRRQPRRHRGSRPSRRPHDRLDPRAWPGKLVVGLRPRRAGSRRGPRLLPRTARRRRHRARARQADLLRPRRFRLSGRQDLATSGGSLREARSRGRGDAPPIWCGRAGRVSLAANREAYEGCAAALRFSGGELAEIRLLPLDLQFDAADGGPRPAALGRSRTGTGDHRADRRTIEALRNQDPLRRRRQSRLRRDRLASRRPDRSRSAVAVSRWAPCIWQMARDGGGFPGEVRCLLRAIGAAALQPGARARGLRERARAGAPRRRARLRVRLGGRASLSRRVLALLGAGDLPDRRGHADASHPRRPRRGRLRARDQPPDPRRGARRLPRRPLRGPPRVRHRALVDVDRDRRLPGRSRRHQEGLGRVRPRAAAHVDAGALLPSRTLLLDARARDPAQAAPEAASADVGDRDEPRHGAGCRRPRTRLPGRRHGRLRRAGAAHARVPSAREALRSRRRRGQRSRRDPQLPLLPRGQEARGRARLPVPRDASAC